MAAVRSRLALAAAFAAGFVFSGCAGRRCCRPCVPCAPDAAPAPVAAAPAGREVFLDILIVRVPEGTIAAALSAPGAASKTPRMLGEADADALVRQWSTTPGVTTLSAPKILALDGQEVTAFEGEVFAPTSGAPDAKGLTFTVEGVEVGENWAGASVRMKAVVSADGRFVTIDLRSAIRVVSSTTPAAPPATTGLSTDATLRFPAAGGSAVFVAPTPLEVETQRSLVAVLVRARVLAPEKATR